MKLTITLIGILMLLCSISGLFSLAYIMNHAPHQEVRVDCYDRYSNVIEGLDCFDTQYDSPIIQPFMEMGDLIALFFTIAIILSSLLVIVGVLEK